MKGPLRSILINALVLYLAALILPGLIFNGQLGTLLMAALALTLLNSFIKPIIKLLLLPINLITLNLFAWVTNAVMLFAITLFVKGYQVVPFHFVGLTAQGFTIPSMDVSQIFSYILASILISALSSFIAWLLKL
jgi:putative membrane protein